MVRVLKGCYANAVEEEGSEPTSSRAEEREEGLLNRNGFPQKITVCHEQTHSHH